MCQKILWQGKPDSECEFIGVKMYLPLLLLVVVGATHGCMPKDSQQRYAQNLG